MESLRQAGEKVATALGKGEGEQRPEWATGQSYPGSVAEGAAGGGAPAQERAAEASPAAETRVRCWVGWLSGNNVPAVSAIRLRDAPARAQHFSLAPAPRSAAQEAAECASLPPPNCHLSVPSGQAAACACHAHAAGRP